MGLIDGSLKAGDGICKFFVGKHGDARVAKCKKRFFGTTVGIVLFFFFVVLFAGDGNVHGLV